MSRRRAAPVSPLREELDALAYAYHHLRTAEGHIAPNGARRRELEERLIQIHARFDRLLEEWVQDDDVRAAWEAHLHNHAPLPDRPPAIDPVVFRGESDAGSFCEVRHKHDELAVWVDGSLLERIEAGRELQSRKPGLVVHVDGFDFREVFRAPPPAIEAVSEFAASGGEPPWEHAVDLLEDGEIGGRFDLTPRGRRAIEEP